MCVVRHRVIRIRPSYYNLCRFLEFKARANNEYEELYEEVFNFSIKYIEQNGFKYSIAAASEHRQGKGFLLGEKTFNEFTEMAKEVKRQHHIFKGELAEIFLYLYTVNYLSEEEIHYLNMDFEIEPIREK